jgi:hypothetical protein
MLTQRLNGERMGMFDDIQCKVPLPVQIGCDHRHHWFQTKSFDCEMAFYKIAKDGSLWKRKYSNSAVNAAPSWQHQKDFIGEIRFYTSTVIIDGEPKTGWLEFSTYFVRGELKHIQLITFEKAKGKHD